MKINKRIKKWFLLAFSSFVPLAAFLSTSSAIESVNNGIFFNGHFYNSYIEIMQRLISDNRLNIDHKKYFFNDENFYANYEKGIVNPLSLHDLDYSKINLAYLRNDKSTTSDYNDAKRSMVNLGSHLLKYTDGFSNYFLDAKDAENSMSSNVFNAPVGLFKFPFYYFDQKNNKYSIDFKYINPLNKKDLMRTKNYIKDNFMDILFYQLQEDNENSQENQENNEEGLEIVLDQNNEVLDYQAPNKKYSIKDFFNGSILNKDESFEQEFNEKFSSDVSKKFTTHAVEKNDSSSKTFENANKDFDLTASSEISFNLLGETTKINADNNVARSQGWKIDKSEASYKKLVTHFFSSDQIKDITNLTEDFFLGSSFTFKDSLGNRQTLSGLPIKMSNEYSEYSDEDFEMSQEKRGEIKKFIINKLNESFFHNVQNNSFFKNNSWLLNYFIENIKNKIMSKVDQISSDADYEYVLKEVPKMFQFKEKKWNKSQSSGHIQHGGGFSRITTTFYRKMLLNNSSNDINWEFKRKIKRVGLNEKLVSNVFNDSILKIIRYLLNQSTSNNKWLPFKIYWKGINLFDGNANFESNKVDVNELKIADNSSISSIKNRAVAKIKEKLAIPEEITVEKHFNPDAPAEEADIETVKSLLPVEEFTDGKLFSTVDWGRFRKKGKEAFDNYVQNSGRQSLSKLQNVISELKSYIDNWKNHDFFNLPSWEQDFSKRVFLYGDKPSESDAATLKNNIHNAYPFINLVSEFNDEFNEIFSHDKLQTYTYRSLNKIIYNFQRKIQPLSKTISNIKKNIIIPSNFVGHYYNEDSPINRSEFGIENKSLELPEGSEIKIKSLLWNNAEGYELFDTSNPLFAETFNKKENNQLPRLYDYTARSRKIKFSLSNSSSYVGKYYKVKEHYNSSYDNEPIYVNYNGFDHFYGKYKRVFNSASYKLYFTSMPKDNKSWKISFDYNYNGKKITFNLPIDLSNETSENQSTNFYKMDIPSRSISNVFEWIKENISFYRRDNENLFDKKILKLFVDYLVKIFESDLPNVVKVISKIDSLSSLKSFLNLDNSENISSLDESIKDLFDEDSNLINNSDEFNSFKNIITNFKDSVLVEDNNFGNSFQIFALKWFPASVADIEKIQNIIQDSDFDIGGIFEKYNWNWEDDEEKMYGKK